MKRRLTALLLAVMLSANLLYVPAAALAADGKSGPAGDALVSGESETEQTGADAENPGEDLAAPTPQADPTPAPAPESPPLPEAGPEMTEEPAPAQTPMPEPDAEPSAEPTAAPEQTATPAPLASPTPTAAPVPDMPAEPTVSSLPEENTAEAKTAEEYTAPVYDASLTVEKQTGGSGPAPSESEWETYAVPGTNAVLSYYLDNNDDVILMDCNKDVEGELRIPAFIDGHRVLSIGTRDVIGGGRVFQNCKKLTKVVIPNGVISIGGGAFMGCEQLQEVSLPNSLVNIGLSSGLGTFGGCTSLKSINIPDGVEYLCDSSFANCNALTEVRIPGSVERIGDRAFFSCENLKRVAIEEGVRVISDDAFAKCSNLTKVSIPLSVAYIDDGVDGAFDYRALKDIYYGGTAEDRKKISLETYRTELFLNQVAWHYQSVLPEEDGDMPFDGQISLDITSAAIKDGGKVTATATVEHSGSLNGTALTWNSSNTNSVTVTPGLSGEETAGRLTSQVTLNGIAPGRSLITVSTADGRSAYCQVTVGSDFFDIQVYHANLLLDEERPFAGIMKNEWAVQTPSSLYVQELQNNGFATGTNIWVAATTAMDTLDNPTSLGEFAFMPKDVYSAIILKVLESATDISVSNGFIDVAKTGSDIYSQLKTWAKLKLNIDISDRTAFKAMDKKQKDEMRSKCEELFLQRSPLGKVEKAFQYFDTVMDIVDCGAELVEMMESNCALANLSDSLKEVVRTMYAQCPADNEYLRMALQDCIKIIDASAEEVVQEIVNGEVKVIGKAVGKYVAGELWKNVKQVVNRAYPYLDILFAAYKSSKFVSETFFGADSLQEQYAVMCAVLDVEDLAEKSCEALANSFRRNGSSESAEAYLSAVDVVFAARREDCKSAEKFIDVLDNALVSKIAQHFDSTSGDKRAKVKKAIENIQQDYDEAHESVTVNWIFFLEEDYPNSGLYEDYEYILAESLERMKKKYKVACPVDVYVYDRGQKLAAYVVDGKAYSNGDISVVVEGDRKTFYFYDEELYDIQYVGTDTGAMDVQVTEYDEQENGIRDVYFADVALTANKTYDSSVNGKTLDDVSYTLSERGGEPFASDLDTYRPQQEKRTVTMKSGNMIISGNMELAAQAYPGERIEVYAYVPAGFTFEGWRSSNGQDIFADKTAYDTTVTVPDTDVTVEAVLHREGYALALEPAGGVLPGEMMLVTDADGKVTSLPEPTLTGCTFLGWYTAAKGGEPVTAQTVFSKDMTLYAHWEQSLPDGYTVEKGILYGVKAGTSVDALQALFGEGENNKLNAADKDGTPLAGGAYVGTGCILTVRGEQVRAMVPCDIDGDGLVGLTDVIQTRKAMVKILRLENEYLEAAQPTGTGGEWPGLSDIIYIRKVFSKIL